MVIWRTVMVAIIAEVHDYLDLPQIKLREICYPCLLRSVHIMSSPTVLRALRAYLNKSFPSLKFMTVTFWGTLDTFTYFQFRTRGLKYKRTDAFGLFLASNQVDGCVWLAARSLTSQQNGSSNIEHILGITQTPTTHSLETFLHTSSGPCTESNYIQHSLFTHRALFHPIFILLPLDHFNSSNRYCREI